MKKLSLRAGLVPLVLILLIAACQKRIDQAFGLQEELSRKGSSGTTNSTGQAIMIDFDVKGTYAVSGDITLEFDNGEALPYFTHNNGVAGTPTFTPFNGPSGESMTSTQITSSGDSSLPSGYWQYFNNSKPLTSQVYNPNSKCEPPVPLPVAPTKDTTKLNALIQDNQCAFLNGDTLTGASYTKSYTSATATCTSITKIYYKKNGPTAGQGWYKEETTINGTYTWVYTFNITVQSGEVAEHTAWDTVATDYSGVAIPVKAKIAGLSAKTWTNNTRKYSFSLDYFDAITGTRVSRISGIQIQLIDPTKTGADSIVVSLDADHSVGTNYDLISKTVPTDPSQPGALDFLFYTNGGMNGTTSLIPPTLPDGPDNDAVPDLYLNARDLLNNDGFSGNDNGGADGTALQIASVPNNNLEIPGSTVPGYYKVRIKCNVKGNDGTADQVTEVAQDIRIIANCKK